MSCETFGEFLKRERELRQISLEEVAGGTKIAIHMLRAMEADRWDEIPAEVFIKGFIKHYSEFIGLVPEDVFLRYQEERGLLPGEDLPRGKPDNALRDLAICSGRRRILLFISLIVVVLLCLGAGYFLLRDRAVGTTPGVHAPGSLPVGVAGAERTEDGLETGAIILLPPERDEKGGEASDPNAGGHE